MADKYCNFAQLAASERENVDFKIRCHPRAANTAIIAPHGGAIEPGTSEIAEKVAADDLSFYAFEGLKTRHNRDLHITSSRFDEPQCISLVESSLRVVTIHGESSGYEVVYLGGLDTTTAADIKRALSARNFSVQCPPDKPKLQGRDRCNICNRGQSRAGVQIEIARGLRETFFVSLDRAGRKKPTQRLTDFVAALREVLT